MTWRALLHTQAYSGVGVDNWDSVLLRMLPVILRRDAADGYSALLAASQVTKLSGAAQWPPAQAVTGSGTPLLPITGNKRLLMVLLWALLYAAIYAVLSLRRAVTKVTAA